MPRCSSPTLSPRAGRSDEAGRVKRPLVHFRLDGQRPACRPRECLGVVRGDLTSYHDEVTCANCRRTRAYRVSLAHKRVR